MIDVKKIKEKYLKGGFLVKDDVKGASADEIIEALTEIGIISNRACEYGEPGCKNPEKEILFGNWNCVRYEVAEILENAGYSVEWDDEWVIANDKKAYKTISGKPWWMPHIFTYSGEVYPIKGNEELYIEKVLLNNPHKKAPEWLDLEEYGFKKVFTEDFHLEENSTIIIKTDLVVEKYAHGKDWIFKIDNLEPWHITYSLWVRQKK